MDLIYGQKPENTNLNDTDKQTAMKLAGLNEFVKMGTQDFINFIERRLIPDLKSSGYTATAGDFEEGIGYLKQTEPLGQKADDFVWYLP